MRPRNSVRQRLGALFLGLGLALGSVGLAPAASADEVTAGLAQQILDLRSAGKITIADYSANRESDSADRSLASQQLEDMATGKPANLSTRCSYASELPPSVEPDVRILRFLTDLGEQEHYKINVLFGQCHSSSRSAHHKGKAVDFGCPLNTDTADSVGAQHEVKRNRETCARNDHWHYSVGGS